MRHGGVDTLDPALTKRIEALTERIDILSQKMHVYRTMRLAVEAGQDPVLYLEGCVRFAEDASDVSSAQFAAMLETQAELMRMFTDPRFGFPVDVDGLRSGLGVDDFDTSSSSSLEFRLRQLDRDSSDFFDELGPLPPTQEDSSVFDELGPLSPILEETLEDTSVFDELGPLPPIAGGHERDRRVGSAISTWRTRAYSTSWVRYLQSWRTRAGPTSRIRYLQSDRRRTRAACRHEKLVAFSCKRHGFCRSCGARRMAETAAHLVDPHTGRKALNLHSVATRAPTHPPCIAQLSGGEIRRRGIQNAADAGKTATKGGRHLSVDSWQSGARRPESRQSRRQREGAPAR